MYPQETKNGHFGLKWVNTKLHFSQMFHSRSTLFWGIPSEKIGQNIHPLESRFFVINYQHWTSTSAFWPILAPLDHWGGLGGLGGDLGGPADPKNDIIARGPF